MEQRWNNLIKILVAIYLMDNLNVIVNYTIIKFKINKLEIFVMI